MADPIRYDDLTSAANRRGSYRLTKLLAHILEGESYIQVVTALASALICVADVDRADPHDVLDQISGALETGSLDVEEELVSDLVWSVH